ncbi:VOC family protein [Actinokineospora diospyrosa]|uniref:Glyoxalase-like domain-containing protein n=1 Tax=Actinokineospora diospyrosa TaxID=103728 RepID=A0ABT1IG28_9PSEU|nr:VOC family protein [Actinokineospora diospyrosa]MCP2271506.1 Glyoxalase-like domain-containing protein [Actinokineospora diospyrosa]
MSPHAFQVVVDSNTPHALADWWAETLGWIVEPSDEDFIRSMIAQGYATDEETTRHNGVLVWRIGAAVQHPDDPRTGTRRRVLFQWVPEVKTVKNRVHLDVWVGRENVTAAVEALVARGATRLHEGKQGPHFWITLTDPEGNEFCVS